MVRIRTTSFTTLKPTDLVASAQENVNGVTNAGALFVGIVPATVMVQTAVSDLSAKIALAKKGSAVQKNNRDAAVTLLIAYLFQWCGFVSAVANTKTSEQDQIEVVEAAAFVPVTRGGSIGALTAVENPRAKGLSQEIAVEWDSKKGAHSYKVMKTEGYATEQSTWTEHIITTRCKTSLEVTAGQVISFVIYPIGTAGTGDQSEFVTAMANL